MVPRARCRGNLVCVSVQIIAQIRTTRMGRVWGGLAVLALVLLVGDEIARSSSSSVCRYGVAAAELEGFGDFDEVEEDDEFIVEVPPVVRAQSGSQYDRGTPSKVTEANEGEEDIDEVEVRKNLSKGDKKAASAWDDEEFESLPPEEPSTFTAELPKKKSEPKKAKIRAPSGPRKPFHPKDFILEGIALLFLIGYGINFWFGTIANNDLATSWMESFIGLFEKQFTLLGKNNGKPDPILMKDGHSTYKLYASGRRYCDSLVAVLELRCRYDLMGLAWNLLLPAKDTLTVEVYMKEDEMEPFVLAVVRKRQAKNFQRENKDLKEFATILDLSARKKWHSDELAVISDCKEAANDILSDSLLDQLFGEKAKGGIDYFVSLHFSDQNTKSKHKRLLRFVFNLPPKETMADLTRLMQSIPFFIDAVGKFRLSAPAKAKAEAARSKQREEEAREQAEELQETVRRRREERKRAEEVMRAERLAKLSPEALYKAKVKEEARLSKGAKGKRQKVMKSS